MIEDMLGNLESKDVLCNKESHEKGKSSCAEECGRGMFWKRQRGFKTSAGRAPIARFTNAQQVSDGLHFALRRLLASQFTECMPFFTIHFHDIFSQFEHSDAEKINFNSLIASVLPIHPHPKISS